MGPTERAHRFHPLPIPEGTHAHTTRANPRPRAGASCTSILGFRPMCPRKLLHSRPGCAVSLLCVCVFSACPSAWFGRVVGTGRCCASSEVNSGLPPPPPPRFHMEGACIPLRLEGQRETNVSHLSVHQESDPPASPSSFWSADHLPARTPDLPAASCQPAWLCDLGH